MPNRWIKEAYLASSRVNAVAPEARDCWVRLLVVADDHGLYHGNPQLVASRCYPLKPDARKCAQLLAELDSAHLILRYVVDGKQYLQILQWYERTRSLPKFPLPPAVDSSCAQVPAGDGNDEQVHAPTGTSTFTSTSTNTSTVGRESSARPKTTVLTEPTTAHRTLASELGVDCAAEFAAYHDHFKANGKRHKDEDAGFRNWLRKAKQYGAPKNGRRHSSVAERRSATMDKLTGRSNEQVIEGSSRRVDSSTFPSIASDLRQPDGGDVGRS